MVKSREKLPHNRITIKKLNQRPKARPDDAFNFPLVPLIATNKIYLKKKHRPLSPKNFFLNQTFAMLKFRKKSIFF